MIGWVQRVRGANFEKSRLRGTSNLSRERCADVLIFQQRWLETSRRIAGDPSGHTIEKTASYETYQLFSSVIFGFSSHREGGGVNKNSKKVQNFTSKTSLRKLILIQGTGAFSLNS